MDQWRGTLFNVTIAALAILSLPLKAIAIAHKTPQTTVNLKVSFIICILGEGLGCFDVQCPAQVYSFHVLYLEFGWFYTPIDQLLW